MADRPAFRPQRARASMSAVPTSSALPPSFAALAPSSKANDQTLPAPAADTTAQKRKKRAQSLGGDALEGASKRIKEREAKGEDATLTLELVPGKMERRAAAPRRSILKQTPALFAGNHTFSFDTSRRASYAPNAKHSHTTDLGSLAASFTKEALTANTTANAVSKAATARRRSSLRPRTSNVSAIGGGSNYDDSDESMEMDEDDDPNGSMDMDMTRFETTAMYDGHGRRKSVAHDRRVSFAANTHVRTYTPDKMTADAQAFAAAVAAQPAAVPATADESFSSTSSAAFSDEEGDANPSAADAVIDDEPSMEISRELLEDEKLSLRFGGHFAGTNVPSAALHVLSGEGEGESDASDEDEDGTQAMDEVTADVVTSAFAQFETNVFNSQAVHQRAQEEDAAAAAASSAPLPAAAETPSIYPSLDGLSTAPAPSTAAAFQLFGASSSSTTPAAASKPRPRFSEIARQEDDDDAEVMKALGFVKGGKPRKSRIAFQSVPEEEEEEGEEEVQGDGSGSAEMSFQTSGSGGEQSVEMEDATGAMDMTVAVGGVLSSSSATVDQQEQDDEDDIDSDAEVSMQLTNVFHASGAADRTVDMTFATEAAPSSDAGDGDGSAMMEDATAAMQEATTYGGILSQSLLTRPAPPSSSEQPGSLFAADQRRRSASPAVQSIAERAASPPKSAPRGTTPPMRLSSVGAQSPFRRTLAPSSPMTRRTSPLPSPRRVAASPAPPAAPLNGKEENPPAKTYAAPSSLAIKSPARSRASVSPIPPPGSPLIERSRARTSRSRSRSVSPVKQQQSAPAPPPPAPAPSTLATPAKAVFNPRTLAPPASAGRSPGGSLSLRALLGTGAGASEGEEKEKKKEGRVGQLRMGEEGGKEEDLTGSEFDSSFEGGGNLPVPPATLDSFFTATGISFVDDILDLAGVDLAQGRRKSVAPTPTPRKAAGPPSFADMAVTGACKSLFYQLYQSDQLRLQEGIQDSAAIYAEQEAAVAASADGDKPRVFKDWANASEEARAVMKSQFRQIKLFYLLQGQLYWKMCRSENYAQILSVMEQNLEGLQEDRARLAHPSVAVSTVIPSLEKRHAQLRADLLAERALDAELSAYPEEDVQLLRDLHADAEEQEEQLAGNPSKSLPGLRPHLDHLTQQLASYSETLQRYTSDELRLQSEIADLEERRRDKRTRADLGRLRGEWEALQWGQGWELRGFSGEAVTMRHWGEFDVAFFLAPPSSSSGKKGLKAVEVEFELLEVGLEKKVSEGGAQEELKAQVTAFLLAKVRDEVKGLLESEGSGRDVRSLIRLISHRCATLRHIRHEVLLASLWYPTSARLITPTSSSSSQSNNTYPVLELSLSVFVPPSPGGERPAKAFDVLLPLSSLEITDVLHLEDWARSISASVKPRFGREVNALGLAQSVNERLEGGDGRGAVLEAVRGAEEECENGV
ncbi:hypothetical protein JCM8547_006781 [Rhodosporidiobolus lusitaniae]